MKTDWILHNFKKNQLICQRCGGTFDMPDKAIEIRMFGGIVNAFIKIHKICKINTTQ